MMNEVLSIDEGVIGNALLKQRHFCQEGRCMHCEEKGQPVFNVFSRDEMGKASFSILNVAID